MTITNIERIGIDLDEVLCDTIPYFLQFYNEKYKTNFSKSDFAVYAWEEVLNISQQDLTEEIREFYSTSYFSCVTPTEGAHKVLLSLKEKFSLSIVTSRWSEVESKTNPWVETHFPDIFNDILFSSNSFVSKDLSSDFSKADLCINNGLNILIEDAPVYLEQCISRGVDVIVYAQPWNRQYTSGVARYDSWDKIGNFLLSSLV